MCYYSNAEVIKIQAAIKEGKTAYEALYGNDLNEDDKSYVALYECLTKQQREFSLIKTIYYLLINRKLPEIRTGDGSLFYGSKYLN
ncbi:MAG: hypothetical protein AAGU27_06205 [Dehalobacterium sp.]